MAKGYPVDFDGRNGNGYQPKMSNCKPVRNPNGEKLEKYAWELVKLKCDKTCNKDALIAQAYDLAEKFLKQTEEKFNEA